MPLNKIPPYTSLTDSQFLQVAGPDGITTGYHYDAQTRMLYFKESQVIYPSFHGQTHIAEDPIPPATCDTPGLMSANDKCKLDTLIGTRLGVLGFQGAGFPDDGGWMQGDIILAAGTEFISLERIGNVVRFTVDSPIPLNCACEECTQIFWLQDETDTSSIRPPTCSGKLPGINSYGEFKIYLFPESTIANPNSTSTTLQNKGQYPALIFKRYDDAITPGSAEYEMILKRNPNNSLQTEIGIAFTPGASGIPQHVTFMGRDDDGGQIRFDLQAEPQPGLFGALLYNGNLITKKMGVIINYTSSIISTNQYTVKLWNADTAVAIGESFTAKNVWQYANAENPVSGTNPQQIILDSSIDLLPLGTLVDLWAFKVGEVAGEAIYRWYFNKKPAINISHLWSWVGAHQFGDTIIAREEVQPGDGSEDKISYAQYSAIRDLERSQWGLTGYDDPLMSYDIASTAGTEGADLTQQHRAVIDTNLPGLTVVTNQPDDINVFSERPVWLWNRKQIANSYTRIDLGRPSSSSFTPYDLVVRANIDEYSEKYMRVIGIGNISGLHYVRICGIHFHDLPPFGTLRILNGDSQNMIFKYSRKFMYASSIIGEQTNPITDTCESIILTNTTSNNVIYPGFIGDIVELLHQEYDNTVIRVEFSHDQVSDQVSVQFKVGNLDMSLPYEQDESDDFDDFVRGLAPGYAVSAVYSQAGTFTGVGTPPQSSPNDFIIYDGGSQIGGSNSEYWNRLEVMVRDDQVWIWWNQLLIPPSSALNANLDTPVTINTPYFPIEVSPNKQFGKNGLRLWPGSSIRRIDIRTQATMFSEFTYGQLEVI